MELLTVFAAPLEFTVMHGRHELGGADAMMLMRKVDGPRLLALGGRAWRVTYIDWNRHRCYVEPADRRARSLWQGLPQSYSYELCQAQREVLLGADPEVELSKRARAVWPSCATRKDTDRRCGCRGGRRGRSAMVDLGRRTRQRHSRRRAASVGR